MGQTANNNNKLYWIALVWYKGCMQVHKNQYRDMYAGAQPWYAVQVCMQVHVEGDARYLRYHASLFVLDRFLSAMVWLAG